MISGEWLISMEVNAATVLFYGRYSSDYFIKGLLLTITQWNDSIFFPFTSKEFELFEPDSRVHIHSIAIQKNQYNEIKLEKDIGCVLDNISLPL